MGRQQQQFQVFFSGMVRRSLLRKFHTQPSIFSPYRERSTSAAVAAGARAEGGRGYLHELFSTSSPATENQKCPIPLQSPNPLQSNGCLSPDEKTRWKIPSVLPPALYGSGHHRSLNLLGENYWVVTRAGLANRRVYAGPRKGEGRGLASLVDKSRSGDFEKVDEAVAEALAEEVEGPRRDEGLSASVSGRETEAHLKKQRRKRKSLIQEVEMADDEVASRTSSMASELEEAATQFSALDIAVASKPSRSPRRKRSKEVLAGEPIFRAFNENAEPSNVIIQQEKPPEVLETPVLSTQVKPPPPLKTTEKKKKKPVELSSDDCSISPPANESTKGERRRKPKPENASFISLDNDGTVLSTATDQEGLQLPAQSTEVPQLGQVIDQTAKPTAGGEPLAVTASVDTKSDSHTVSNVKETGVTGENAGVGGMRKAEATLPGKNDEPVPVAFADPQALYRELSDSKGGRSLQGTDKAMLNSVFYRFASSGWVSDQALSLYINSKFFPSAAAKFRKFFVHKSSQELRSFVVSKGPTNVALQFLFPIFAEFCINEFPTEIGRYRELVSTADMTKPDAWYPFARAMRRKVIYHKGPTNSGKTYNALKRYMEAANGIYCSPLRLLAMEVFDTVNVQGVYCNLHTGQEKRDVPFANHLACTVEMCYLTRQWEVAVIDEIQMMSDEYRGWAWTRAFLGLQADEIHVCGDPSALPLIRSLCAGTGDDLVEYEYERFVPLEVAKESLRGDFRNIEAGDCIVAFSRRDIFDIKREVELASKHRCCVVYGALPPETRTHQAKLFNTADNGYNVLVASDAIGMGLNLNIRRVVFFALDKFDGDSKKPVPPAQVKQIAGRAGRRGSLYPEGVTTTFFSQDLPYLEHSMQQGFDTATAAGLFPVYEQVELFASQLPNETFAKLLERFSETCRLDGAFFLCRYDNLKRVANMLEKVKGLSLEDRFNFCFAPVNVRDPQSMAALYRYATAFSQKIPVHVEMGVPFSSAKDEFELLDLEARHQVLSMYLWLSQHFRGELFPQKEQAGEMASQIAVLLGQSLVQSSRRWAKRKLVPQHGRGRPYPTTGRLQNDKLGTGEGQGQDRERSWRDGITKPAETFVPA